MAEAAADGQQGGLGHLQGSRRGKRGRGCLPRGASRAVFGNLVARWQGRCGRGHHGHLGGQHLKAHLGAAQAQAGAQLGPGHHFGAGGAQHPGLAHPAGAGGAEHVDTGHPADLGKGLPQLGGLETLLPAVHGAALVEVGHAHQVGELLGPEIATVLRAAAAAAVEHGVGEAGAIHQHLAAGAGHGGPGGGGLGVQAPVHLAGHGGAHVEGGAGLALTQGIGAGRHRLGPQGLLGPAGRHLTAHHAGQVALQQHMVDRLQPAAAHQHLQPAPVAALAQLERAGLV